ncbi:MAG: peptide-methionine (R)-S-oxide reductase MsrB, partial [Pseudomonadota bacterium]
MLTRRHFAALGFGGAIAAWFASRPGTVEARGPFPLQKSEAEWRKILSKQEFYVLREHGTERPFTSPLDKIYDPGIYHCAGCDTALFSSEHKFDSRTGWPSFYKPLPNAIGESTDYLIGYARTEVHCANCGGHQGHVFKD